MLLLLMISVVFSFSSVGYEFNLFLGNAVPVRLYVWVVFHCLNKLYFNLSLESIKFVPSSLDLIQ